MNACCKKWNRAAVFSIHTCSGDLWNSILSSVKGAPFLIQFCPDCGLKLDDNTMEGLRKFEEAMRGTR